MDIFTHSDMQNLLEAEHWPSVSIFMPTHKITAANREDPIRFKNLLHQAEDRLKKYGMRPSAVKDILRPAADLIDDTMFWKHQGHGLALFVSEERMHMYRVSLAFESFVSVASRFYIKPLLPLLNPNRQFYILALSQDKVRLFKGDRFQIADVPLQDMPVSLAEALRNHESQKQLQFHTRSRPVETGVAHQRAAMFHGHGVGIDDEKENIKQFFRKLDRGLHDMIQDRKTPLFLAGVDYECAMFRAVSHYPNVHGQVLEGNPQQWRADEIHARSWNRIRPVLFEDQEKALNAYRATAHTANSADDIEVILPAARSGRVGVLFVDPGCHLWGRYDMKNHCVNVHDREYPQDEDLLDTVAAYTIRHGGDVYADDDHNGLFKGSPVAAMFRY